MGVVSSVEEHSFHTRVVAGSNPALHIMYFCVSGRDRSVDAAVDCGEVSETVCCRHFY